MALCASTSSPLACRRTDGELKDFCSKVTCLGSVVPPTLLRSASEQHLATMPPFLGMKSRGFEASRGVEAAHQTPLITRNDVK